MTQDKAIVADFWSRVDCSASDKNFYCFPPIRARSCNMIFGEYDSVKSDWCEYWTIEKYLKDKIPFENCLSICCGFGEIERLLSKYNAAKHILGCDIAPGAIEKARERAAQEGLDNIEYLVADLNNNSFKENQFDLIWANGALHHIEKLDSVIPMLYRSLRPGGYLISNEFVGPRYQQIPPRQQEIVNAVRHLLFPEFRREPEKHNLFGQVWQMKPTEYFLKTDPSECVNSQNIIPTLQKYFDNVKVKYFDGSIIMYALDSQFYHNFDFNNHKHRKFLELLFQIEDTFVEAGEIGRDNAHIICKKADQAPSIINREIATHLSSRNSQPQIIDFSNIASNGHVKSAEHINNIAVNVIPQAKTECVFLNTYPAGFIESHYANNPQLYSTPYAQQLKSLQDRFLGGSFFNSTGLEKAGLHAENLIINCNPLQQAWANGNNFSGQGLNIAIEQIRRIKPKVVYFQNMDFAIPDFLSDIRTHTELIVGQIAAPVPAGNDLCAFDIIFSSLPHYVEKFRSMGITSYYQPLAFDPQVLENIPNAPKKYPVTFIGGITPLHRRGQQILEDISKLVPVDCWGYGLETLPPDSGIRKNHHGPVWGLDMFSTLQQSLITLNRHADVAQNYANNARLFEATGCGAMLITDYKENLNQLFEIGTEIVAYRNPDEAASLIKHYCKHQDQALKIARAGQSRTLRDHTYKNRITQTAQILSRHLQ